MKKTSKHWTKKEVRQLLNTVSSSVNRPAGLKNAADQLGRTVAGCAFKYYQATRSGKRSYKQRTIIRNPTLITTNQFDIKQSNVVQVKIKGIKIENNNLYIMY